MNLLNRTSLLLLTLTWGISHLQAQAYSPNRLHNTAATVFLADGQTVQGQVSLNNEVLLEQYITVSSGKGNTQKLHLLDVKGYEQGGTYYELKHTGNHIHPRSGFYFMRRLTPEQAPLHLYEHMERRQKGKSPSDIVYVPAYYVQLPESQAHRVFAANGNRFTPNFHHKVSNLVRGCPHLAEQVRNKQKGYHFTRLDASPARQKEVFLRIIEVYSNCRAVSHDNLANK